ncbi:GNAT family N-acetyltransferase [Francisella adeliensis]|uniref:GNAT family N-acetyltransferase n=1 Tax=Francisella adeliensis TaxID=2007306 RepID=UPI00190710F7|nr:GNAT family N-acetyltransferase [Francisella adeliensis]
MKLITRENYEELIEVWEGSVRVTHHFLPEENILELKPLILQHYFDAVELRCITKNGEIAGFVGVADANIEMLFVSPKYFRQNIGSQLVNYTINHLDASKVDVNEQNSKAIEFYEKVGFKKVGRSELDGQGNPFPLIHMEWSGI